MKYCTRCGNQLENEAIVCSNCGNQMQPTNQTTKFCTKCGNELRSQAVFCPKCGCQVESSKKNSDSNTMKTIAKVFMIISTVLLGFYLIPLAWCLPMTLSYCNKIKNGEQVSVAFKVCTLLFVSVVAGILMLCDQED